MTSLNKPSKQATPAQRAYCNLHKGPWHKSECANPSQCYCSCHRDEVQTNRELNKQIKYHLTRVETLKRVLESRPV